MTDKRGDTYENPPSRKDKNPGNDETRRLKKLQAAVESSRRRLDSYRIQWTEYIKEYVGSHYGENAADKRVVVNLISLAIDIMTRSLVARNPHALVRTEYPSLLVSASELELATNRTLEDVGLCDTLRMAYKSAMFMMGIVKTGIKTGQSVEIDGESFNAGQPFAANVLFDHWVHDMNARTIGECSFMGDRYRLPFDVLKSPMYDQKVVKSLRPTDRTDSGLDSGGDDRAEDIPGGAEDSNRYEDVVEVWDLYLPREKRLMTVTSDCSKVLRSVEWTGPDEGPYHILGFYEVPGSVIPRPPVMVWKDLHDMANELWRKIRNQAERQKTVTGVRGGGDLDGDRIKKADDGDMIPMDDPKNVQEISMGGVDEKTMLAFLQTKNLFSWISGNLDSLGGLGAQAETLGQEQMIASSSGQLIEEMRSRTQEFAKKVVKSLAWYLWTDPLSEMQLSKRVPGYEEINVPFTWNDESKEGDFLDYNFDITPYSMQESSPQQVVMALMEAMQGIVMPLMPMIEAQGGMIDVRKVLELYGKHRNLPEITQIVKFSDQVPEREPSEPRQSPVTQRNYTRRNVGGMTRRGADDQMAQLMMGAGGQ